MTWILSALFGGHGKARDRAEAHPEEICGMVTSGFEPVRDAFIDNFAERGELGGAVCVVVAGEVVVDLCGGLRDRATGAPWSADTMTLVHSTTKGLSAMVLALLHSRGRLDYDEQVAGYWMEFAQRGKEDITVRQLLAHQARLFAFDERVDRDVVADLDRLAGVMERQRPIWPPGERQAYHAVTLGFSENELVRRIDPHRRTIGQVLQEDIAAPLGLGGEVYIGTPHSVPDERLAAVVPPGLWTRLRSMPISLTIDAMRPILAAFTDPGERRARSESPRRRHVVDRVSSRDESGCRLTEAVVHRTCAGTGGDGGLHGSRLLVQEHPVGRLVTPELDARPQGAHQAARGMSRLVEQEMADFVRYRSSEDQRPFWVRWMSRATVPSAWRTRRRRDLYWKSAPMEHAKPCGT